MDPLKKAAGSWPGGGVLDTIGSMTGISDRAVVRRLNDRLGFGPAPGDLEAGVDATVRRLLGPTTDAAAAAIAPPTGLEPPMKENKQKGAVSRPGEQAGQGRGEAGSGWEEAGSGGEEGC